MRRHRKANLFAYARNNPLSFDDPAGTYAQVVLGVGAVAAFDLELSAAVTLAVLSPMLHSIVGFDPVSVRSPDEIENEMHRLRHLEYHGNDDMRRWAASARGRLTLELDIARGEGEMHRWRKPNDSQTNGPVGYDTWSQKRWGHTWTRHGAQADPKVLARTARLSNKPQGQWVDNDIAREFLVENIHRMQEVGKPVFVDLPAGVEARVYMPDGRVLTDTVSKARLIPIGGNSDVFRTAYPVPP